jgi:hypothetical protein
MKIKFDIETTMLPVLRKHEGDYDLEIIDVVNATNIYTEVINYLKADIKDLIFTNANIFARMRKIYPEVKDKTVQNRTDSYLKYMTSTSGEVEALNATDGNKKPLYRFRE